MGKRLEERSMITNIEGVTNGKVLVVYDHHFKVVSVSNNATGKYMTFSEYTDMWELYNAFKESFTRETDYKTALLFFKPDIIDQDGYKDKI